MAYKGISAIFAALPNLLSFMIRRKLFFIFLFTLWLAPLATLQAAPFTVVLDAGHGGKDPGTLGSSCKEKDVVLSIALKLGALIKQEQPEVKVIYTRSTDEFIELNRRADIANKAKANLFISMHADHAETSTVKGASTFTLGQNRTAENMAIAKRENSVILREDNYKERYEGFDPNSPESYIMFEFMQSNYMDQSIRFASKIQSQFKKDGRQDRGVRQDVFLVLRNTSMPSALIEVGFLSNPDEERFLKSDEGQDKVARSIYNGFADFKADYERKTSPSASFEKIPDTVVKDSTEPAKADSGKKTISSSADQPSTQQTSKIEYKVQILVVDRKLKAGDYRLKGLTPEFYMEKKSYKYTSGSFNTFKEADNHRKSLSKKFPDCFVIAFQNEQKIAIDTARSMPGQ